MMATLKTSFFGLKPIPKAVFTWLRHIGFWSAVLFFFTIILGRQSQNYLQNFLFALLLLPVTLGTSYLLIYWLMPAYLFRKKYGLFFLYFLYALVISFWLENLIIILAFVFFAEYQVENMNPATLDVFFLLAGTYVVIFASISIKLFQQWNQMQQAKLKAEIKLKEAELGLLKAQIHPHFLFNTLNTLYGLALEKSDQTAHLIIKLSEWLDYSLYHSQHPKVSLDKEVQYLQNYIDLEKVRLDSSVSIHFEQKGDSQGLYIAPLLWLSLLENSFKHGLQRTLDKSYLSVLIHIGKEQCSFQVENSKPTQASQGLSIAKSGGGLGLENLGKRLDLLYPNHYSLEIENQSNYFRVELSIDRQYLGKD